MKKIPLATPHMGGRELYYVNDAFEKNWVAPLGENVNEFENTVADYVGVKAGAALSSGTAALHLAIKLAEVKEGDYVFCSTLTFAASANPIIYEKAIPVFIDSEHDTWNMCPKCLELAFQKYPSCKTVIVVNLYGISANYDEIKRICDKYNAKLIEDAAESLGTDYKGKMTGSFGDYGILSFNGNKIITTSGGGMLLSNDLEAIKKSRFWATQSRENELWYEHKELGFNYRMSNIVAGVGRGQMEVLEKRVEKKNEIFELYKEKLNSKYISMMPNPNTGRSNKWLSCIVFENNKINPIIVLKNLAEKNIETRPIWKPMHQQPFFEKYDYITIDNVSDDIFKRGLCLPSDTKMTIEEQLYVIDCINKEVE